jgi:hypothetical protein
MNDGIHDCRNTTRYTSLTDSLGAEHICGAPCWHELGPN